MHYSLLETPNILYNRTCTRSKTYRTSHTRCTCTMYHTCTFMTTAQTVYDIHVYRHAKPKHFRCLHIILYIVIIYKYLCTHVQVSTCIDSCCVIEKIIIELEHVSNITMYMHAAIHSVHPYLTAVCYNELRIEWRSSGRSHSHLVGVISIILTHSHRVLRNVCSIFYTHTHLHAYDFFKVMELAGINFSDLGISYC